MSDRRFRQADPLTAWRIAGSDGRRLGVRGSRSTGLDVVLIDPDSRRTAGERYSDEWLLAPSADGWVVRNVQAAAPLGVRSDGSVVAAETEVPGDVLWIDDSTEGGRCTIGIGEMTLQADVDGSSVTMREGEPPAGWTIEPVDPSYPVPEPRPTSTGTLLVGAQMCNLWMGERWPSDHPFPTEREPVLGWSKIKPYPGRMPVIGWYDEGTPVATDWEIRMASEAGIGFFMPCWYRSAGNEGKPVREELAHWMHGLKNARYRDRIRYFLMWENLNDIACGVSDERDLLENLMPFLIDTYFRDESYLKIHDRPVLSVYGPARLIEQLGGPDAARASFERAAALCERAGFAGLTLIGQYCWGPPSESHEDFREAGFEATMSYHWPTFADGALPEPNSSLPSYSSDEIIRGHQMCWREQENGALPNIVTASMGWDSAPWGKSVTERAWTLEPGEFEALLELARDEVTAKRQDSLASTMVLLDNWNEFGEGHYIMPTAGYGFSYLDAVARVFGAAGRETG